MLLAACAARRAALRAACLCVGAPVPRRPARLLLATPFA
jgi:hypothetical protein